MSLTMIILWKTWHLILFHAYVYHFKRWVGGKTIIRWKSNFCTLPTPLLSFPPKNWGSDLAKNLEAEDLVKAVYKKSNQAFLCKAKRWNGLSIGLLDDISPCLPSAKKKYECASFSSVDSIHTCSDSRYFKFEMFDVVRSLGKFELLCL